MFKNIPLAKNIELTHIKLLKVKQINDASYLKIDLIFVRIQFNYEPTK